MSIELTITVKDEARTLRRDFLLYQPILMSDEDPMVAKCLQQTLEDFKSEPSDVKIKSVMVIK